MVELWIDGHRCDVGDMPVLPIDFDIEKLSKVEGLRNGRTIHLTLPATLSNDAVFGSSKDIYATARFNSEHHAAELKSDGMIVFKGTVYLCSATLGRGSNATYKIRICEGGAEWIEPVVYGSLAELEIPFSGWLNLSTVIDSWGEESRAIRFLPVRRGDKRAGFTSSSTMPIEWVMLSDDYHPFISIAEMVRAMFVNTGYNVRSNFFDSDFGQSLYMSGDYTRSEATAAKERCDFFARRSKPVTATADAMGRVFTSMSFDNHTLGPIVDTADSSAFDSNGVQMIETFNTMHSFSKTENGDICFTPSRAAKVGFMLHLEYTTDYKILSRERLVGFNVVEGLHDLRVEYPLVNTCKDLRDELSANWHYRAIVFDHTDGREYALMTVDEDGEAAILAEWSARSEHIYTTEKKPLSATLLFRDDMLEPWDIYEEDWALYSGNVEEEGELDVTLDLRIPPQNISAGERYILDKVWFSGAEYNMKLTLGVGTTLRPYFTTVPGYGSKLLFKDIAPRNIRQAELLDALGEMFNLVFYTDRERKEVYIEPLEQLYSSDEEIDIGNRIDVSRDIEIVDAGFDMPQRHKFSYKDADSASHALNLETDSELGCWSYRNPLYGTNDSTKEYGNKLFTTTVNVQKIVAFAPSASLMQVGDVGMQEMGIDVGFTPHIVCYKGLKELPEDERWIANNSYDHYPYAAFMDDEDINLGFEERNGIAGLADYHKARLMRQQESQRVVADVALTTAEMATLLTDCGGEMSVRRHFRFDLNGESSLYRIVKIEKWDMASGTVRCTFERILKD